MVSIIIPTKDRAALLPQTIQSIRAQTYANWEAVIIDDGSTDDTVPQMQRLGAQEPRIRFLQRQGDKSGAQVCRNQGSAAAKGEYLIFLDSDDLLAPACLQHRVAFMQQHPSLGFAVFQTQLFAHELGDTPRLWNSLGGKDDLDRFLKRDSPWQTTGPIWRRTALDQVGPFDETLLSYQDWEFHIRALCKGIAYQKVDKVDCFYRVHSGPKIANSAKNIRHMRSYRPLLVSIGHMLSQGGLLTPQRRAYLAGNCFWLADVSLLRDRRPTEARLFWRLAYDQQWINLVQYLQGLALFRLYGIAPTRQRLRRFIAGWWPQFFSVGRSPTFQKTPINHREPSGPRASREAG